MTGVRLTASNRVAGRCASTGRTWPQTQRDVATRVARAAKHNAENPERRATYVRARRAKIRKATVLPFSAAEFNQRMAFFGRRCWMCGGSFEHVDHVKPLSKGGLHCLANLRPACARCNLTKKAKWPLSREALAWLSKS